MSVIQLVVVISTLKSGNLSLDLVLMPRESAGAPIYGEVRLDIIYGEVDPLTREEIAYVIHLYLSLTCRVGGGSIK